MEILLFNLPGTICWTRLGFGELMAIPENETEEELNERIHQYGKINGKLRTLDFSVRIITLEFRMKKFKSKANNVWNNLLLIWTTIYDCNRNIIRVYRSHQRLHYRNQSLIFLKCRQTNKSQFWLRRVFSWYILICMQHYKLLRTCHWKICLRLWMRSQ